MSPIFLRICRNTAYVLFLVVLFQGCAEINHLRDAQDAFTRTATLENEYRFGLANPESFEPGADASVSTSVRAGYASVVHSLNSLDETAIGRLKAENLYGVVLTLKAMSYLRLGEYDAAMKEADKALQLDPSQLGPRDRALMKAMPGLVRNDQAFQMIYAPGDAPMASDERVRSIVGLLNSAEEKLADARKEAGADHGVQRYLVQAQLAADKNLNDVCDRYARADGSFDIAKDGECKGWTGPWGSNPRFDCRTFAHIRDFEGLLTPDQQEGASVWRKAVGNPPKQKPAGC